MNTIKKYHCLLLGFLFSGCFICKAIGQPVSIVIRIADSILQSPLPGATIQAGRKFLVADSSGSVIVNATKGESLSLTVSFTGYATYSYSLLAADTTLSIFLQHQEDGEETVIVSSTRNNSRIEDLATRVEVLGRDEMNEENGIKPGNIVGILGDFAGIQIQQTNAATNNADMRIQGLPGKYTQVLRDGLPLYGGFGSSFNLLQIPPLDLQQIELIKGSSSTLYGGGAIAGMVNLISKKPALNKPENTLTINQTTLKETNLNLFSSARNKNMGYTLFAGGNYQQAVDVNNDGFSDVANVKSATVHPRLFLFSQKGSELVLGYSGIFEDRKGGDMLVLDNGKSQGHEFFIRNKTMRHTVDGIWNRKLSANASLITKGSFSFLDRDISTNVFGMHAGQSTGYAEISYNRQWTTHNLVAGVNYYGDYLRIRQPDSSHLSDRDTYTFGAFLQDDWKISSKLTAQAGIRADGYHDGFGKEPYVLPRISLKYRISNSFTVRAGGGLGYKPANVFNTEIDERDYRLLTDIGKEVKAERSSGINGDINYHERLGEWSLTINQAFYYTSISKPLLYRLNNNLLELFNESENIRSSGAETYVMAKHQDWEYYLGYTYTDAKRTYNAVHPYVPLTARHKFAALISTEIGDNFRTGIESSFVGKQFLDNGSQTNSYVMMAFMMRYDAGRFSFVLNGENLLDYRQSKQEAVVFPPFNNPTFPELWAPLDGRVINFSVQVKW